ncbi:MAG: VWA domain-containing protein [Acidobacteria bacterium]|nr:VWA domain-containing protein [Acidobacteriota bacterium]MBW4045498.1 VWA domain-containing protein [Acidobacteriota bacterium]
MALFLMGGLQQQQQSIPDAPAPQPAASSPANLSNLKNSVTPGEGTAKDATPDSPQSQADQQPAPPPEQAPVQQTAPELPVAGQGPSYTIHVPVNEILVPVTVRDKKGNLVPGLTWRQFRVYEDGQPQRISFFTVDPFPLSVAFVIDASVPADVMHKVNESLAAVPGAFSPADSVAIFTYNTSPTEVTTFTAAEGNRLVAAFQSAKRPGRDMGVPALGGPLDNGPMINNKQVDPNMAPQRGSVGFIKIPKENHPLNDAILAAAKALASQPKGRRRILYVISDGKEAGSKATYKEVVRYMLTNNISLYGTLVGESAMWGMGYLDKMHLPLIPTMRDNILPKYAFATGGVLDSEFSENGIQRSFAKITQSVRTQYTLGYISHAPIMSSKFHTIDVRVEGITGLDVQARDGYYPSSADIEQ